MNAGRDQAERRASSGIGIRLRIHVGSRIQKQIRDLDNILRCLLTIALDTVRRDVVEQSGTMLASRSFMRQAVVGGEQLPEPCCLAVDDGVSRRFECGYGRVYTPQFSYVPGKLRPTLESVFASDEKLSAGERTIGCFSRSLRELVPML